MQKIKMKDGKELVSLELNKDRAVMDIVGKFLAYVSKDIPFMQEMTTNMPHSTGAIMVIRGVKEFVDLKGCSEDFREVVQGQREFVEMLLGDREKKVVEIDKIVRPI